MRPDFCCFSDYIVSSKMKDVESMVFELGGVERGWIFTCIRHIVILEYHSSIKYI